MTDVAAEFAADMARLPAAEQAMEKSRIDALLEAAAALATGAPVPFAAAPAAGWAGAISGSLGPTRTGQGRGPSGFRSRLLSEAAPVPGFREHPHPLAFKRERDRL